MLKRVLSACLLWWATAAPAGPLEDAVSLVFEWNQPPAPVAQRQAFESDLAKVLDAALKTQKTASLLAFNQDKVAYQKGRVESGEIEEHELWKHAEGLTKAKHDAAQAEASYRHLRESVAQRWGGDQWYLLKDLLGEIANLPLH